MAETTTTKATGGEKVGPVPTATGGKTPSLSPLTTQSHEGKKPKKTGG